MKTCARIRPRIPALQARLLTAAEERAIRDHLDHCPDCSAELRAQELIAGELRALPAMPAPPSFMADLDRRMAREKKPHGVARRLFFPLRIKLPLEALGMAALAAVVFMIYRPYEAERLPVSSDMEQSSTMPAGKKTAESPDTDRTADLRRTESAKGGPAPSPRQARERLSGETAQKPIPQPNGVIELAKKKDSAAVEEKRMAESETSARAETVIVIERNAPAPTEDALSADRRDKTPTISEKKRSRILKQESTAPHGAGIESQTARDPLAAIAALARSRGGRALSCEALDPGGACRAMTVIVPATRYDEFIAGCQTLPGVTTKITGTGSRSGDEVRIRIERAP